MEANAVALEALSSSSVSVTGCLSIQAERHLWCTQRVDPMHLHGSIQSLVSREDSKQIQHVLASDIAKW